MSVYDMFDVIYLNGGVLCSEFIGIKVDKIDSLI